MKNLYALTFAILASSSLAFAQNVGIGTNNPQEKLDVDGNIRFQGGELSTGNIDAIVPFYIRGTGVNNNSNQVLIIGNTAIYNAGSRGLRLTVINKTTYAVVSDQSFDTYGSTAASDNLATALNGISNGQIGILTSYDAWEGQVTTNLDNALKKLGLTKAFAANNNATTHRKPYAAIFEAANGVNTAKAVEVLIPSNSAAPYAEVRGWLIAGSFVAAPTLPNALMNVDGTAVGLYVDENNAVNANGNNIQNVATPANGTDAVNKNYVDGLVTGNDDWDLSSPNLYPKQTSYNIGIGTTNAAGFKLNVAGTSKFGGQMDMSSFKITSLLDPSAAQDAATKNYVDGQDEWTLAGNSLYPKSTGYNIGIGNTNPGAFKLNVTGEAYFYNSIQVSGQGLTGAGIKLADDGDIVDMNDGYATHRFSYGLRLTNANSGGSTTVQIANGAASSGNTYFNTSGNFGIGNNNPTTKLDITGNLRTSADGWNYMDNVTADSWNGLFFRSASNSFTEGGFLLQQNDSEAGAGTTAEDVRFTIGVFNDFRQGGGHSDELWFQGGGRLVSNVGLWDSELNTIVGTPGAGVTGGYEWRVNNSNRMVLDHNGTLTLNNYTGSTRRPLYVDNNGTVTAGTGNDNSLWSIAMNFASSPDDLSGGDVLIDQDDAVANYNLPFTYTIEGVGYSNITISSNGWIAFGTVGGSFNSPSTLPSSSFSTPVIFPFWTDLKDFGSGEYVRAYSYGTSPNRVVIVHHRSKSYCSNNANPGGGDRIIEYQVQIHENGGINVKYITATPTMNGQQISCGGTYNVAIGFQLSGGSNAKVFPISYNAKVLDDNRQPESWSVSPIK